MKCTQCDANVPGKAIFCPQCGHKLHGKTRQSGEDGPRGKFSNAVAGIDREDTAEEELWQGKFSSRAMFGPWIGASVYTLGLLTFAAFRGFSGTAWGIVAAMIVVIWVALYIRLLYRQLSEHYYLSNRRFIHERGLLWRESDRIEAIDIDDVSFQQGPIERMLGVGTVQIRSSDNSHPLITLPGIEKVREVAEMIDEVRRQERLKRGLHIEAV